MIVDEGCDYEIVEYQVNAIDEDVAEDDSVIMALQFRIVKGPIALNQEVSRPTENIGKYFSNEPVPMEYFETQREYGQAAPKVHATTNHILCKLNQEFALS